MYCPDCGSQNAEGSAYCSNCGHIFKPLSSETEAVAAPAAQKKSKKGLVIGLVCGLAVLCVAAVLAYILMFSGPAGNYVIEKIDGKPAMTYYKEMAEARGKSVDDLLENMGISKSDLTGTVLTLDRDGSAVLMFGREKASGTWTKDGSSVELDLGYGTLTGAYSGGRLSAEYDGVDVILRKK